MIAEAGFSEGVMSELGDSKLLELAEEAFFRLRGGGFITSTSFNSGKLAQNRVQIDFERVR